MRTFLAASLYVGLASAQPAVLFDLPRDGAAIKPIAPATRAQLGDPFFQLVLKDKPGETRLSEIEKLVQPNAANRQIFVVDETIADPALGQSRRAVLTFTGNNKGIVLSPNVMMSLTFSSSAFPENLTFLEVLGWDDRRGRYNYYKLDRQQSETKATWKFRGSSVNADTLTLQQRTGTCLACHINGAPVMKELPFPWNNWHSFKFQATYLTASDSARWPVSQNPRFGGLKGAETLETDFILPAITNFSTPRINSLLRRKANGTPTVDSDGLAEVLDGPRLLKPLFETTEFNMISSDQLSGLHPLPAISGRPGAPVVIPATFFLNANIIAGQGVARIQGLGISEAQEFSKVAAVSPVEYEALIRDSGVKLGGQQPGDANFAWFVPEPSHVDNDLIDRLLRRGVITPQFGAAVLLIDLENPMFSASRMSLRKVVPATFKFKPIQSGANAHPDDLSKKVIATLEAAQPAGESAEKRFLDALKNPDAVALLRSQVAAYRSRVSDRLNGSSTRAAELRRLYDLAIARRRAAKTDPVLESLDETGDKLFPLP